MTQCNSRIELGILHSKEIVADFDGGLISTDGELILLKKVDEYLGLTKKLAAAVTDGRDPSRIKHPLGEMFAQRIYQIACGYEDCNDADDLPDFNVGVVFAIFHQLFGTLAIRLIASDHLHFDDQLTVHIHRYLRLVPGKASIVAFVAVPLLGIFHRRYPVILCASAYLIALLRRLSILPQKLL